MALETRDGLGSYLKVVDERQRLLKEKTTVTLNAVGGANQPYRMSSKAGTPTRTCWTFRAAPTISALPPRTTCHTAAESL